MQQTQSGGRRTSEPIKLNNFSKSDAALNKFLATNGGDGMKSQRGHQANTVQTLVVGTTTGSLTAGLATSPPKGNGFSLTGPVTDL